MSNRGKMIGWGVALAAVVAMVTAGTVYADTGSAQVGLKKTTLSSQELRSLLVPLSEQSGSVGVQGPITLQEAAAAGAFALVPGMVFAPKSCSSYIDDVLGLGSREGWVQFGARAPGTFNDFFFQTVVSIPGGVDLDKIRKSAATCASGTLTLDGQVTGDVTVTERTAPTLGKAATFAITHATTFSPVRGAEQAAVLAQYTIAEDEQCAADTVFVAMGDVLIITMESNGANADQLATTMHSTAKTIMS